MTTVVACPECKQNLKLPAEHLGQDVRCPGCEHVFTASAGTDITASRSAAPPPVPDTAVPAWEKPHEDDLAKPLDEEEAAEIEADATEAERRKRRKEEKKTRKKGSSTYDDLMQRQRKMQSEHRGVLILVYGILSLVFHMCLVGVYFGAQAWIWANNDLNEMYTGRMDRSGEMLTNVGRILGMVGLGLFFLEIAVACGCGVLTGIGARR
jgi:hypothetical protein